MVLLLLAVASTAWSADPPPTSSAVLQPPAEETRLNAVQFREALKKRGLSEILELHLKDFPPTNATTTHLLMREVKLAEFADASRPVEERGASIAEANRILQQLVEDNPEDARRFQWQYTLGHSLLYEEAEPFSTNILYFGGNDDDRARLTVLASRAVEAVRSLAHRLQDESVRIDRLPTQEFEAIEQRGYVDELDRLMGSADYLLLWAMFYDALPRADDDSTRARELNEIIETFAVKPSILQTPHERSHVQAPALLLAGMTHRRLNDHAAAREQLDGTVALAQRLTDVVEKERIQWAVTLATIEMARNDRDDGRFKDALSAVARLRGDTGAGSEDRFGLRLAAAVLEKSVHEARASAAEKAGRPVEVTELRALAWKTLAQLASEEPHRRDAIYAVIYRTMGHDADVGRLDPFEQCAYIAGLISEAESSPKAAPTLLDRAIAAGERVLSQSSEGAKSLAPEVIYHVAVAHYRKGDHLAASRRFIEAARFQPKFDRALNAGTLAVQLAAELYHDAGQHSKDEVTALYRMALEVLLTNHAGTEAERYWRFYYAQLLDELGEFDAAAEQFRLVDAAHEHFLHSGFLRIRSLAAALQRAAADSAGDAIDLILRADTILSAYRDFMARAGEGMSGEPQSPNETSPRRLLAEARVLTAETTIVPRIDRPAQAIELLSNFEQDYPEEPLLWGRVWRVRLLGYEALGQLEEATRAIPAYVAAAPDSAGPTLRGLYAAMIADVDKLRAAGNEGPAQQKAEVALLLAEQLNAWAETNDATTASVDRRELRVQLAEANLQAGRYERARVLFDECASPQDGVALSANETDLRVAFGQAESLFRLGQFAEALPKFNRLATGLTPTHPIRWKSLLRDLECRSALGEPAAGIIKVIEQQKYLHPELGGTALAAEFERVRRDNERRLTPE
jgi:tetratricopeptide (TPR) repeat protein